jgi:hypothetical protein
LKRALLVVMGFTAACAEPTPRAMVRIHGPDTGLGHAVLVMPTRCVDSQGDLSLCSPVTYTDPNLPLGGPPPATFATLIDPILRLKLEFAGYTLAEAAAMTVTTGDRVDTSDTAAHDGAAPITASTAQVTPGVSLADLEDPAIIEVARSLQLSGVITSTLRVDPARYGQKRFTLTVELRELGAAEPSWSVRCAELFLEIRATSALLGNCAGNGVLAVFSPDNLMGRPL